jgi:hypothetical protein
MSSYFENYKKVLYLFGNETSPVAFQDLSSYVSLIDKIGEQISAYIEYEIVDFERPDTLSYRLYGNAEYDWTFFLMNDKLRERGWPLPLQDLYDVATKHYYKDWVCQLGLTTADSAAYFADKYPVGQPVKLNGKDLIVKSKDLQIGEITLYSPYYSPDRDSDFSGLTALSYDDGTYGVGLDNTVPEYWGTYGWYDSAGNSIDYFFRTPDPKDYALTNLDHLVQENDELKRIRVIKKELIGQVVGQFKSLSGK